jgi:hypothetical protein
VNVRALRAILAQLPDTLDVVVPTADGTGAYMRVKKAEQLPMETDQVDEPVRFWPAGADIEQPVVVLVLR